LEGVELGVTITVVLSPGLPVLPVLPVSPFMPLYLARA
jgi:hypothetical protein